MLFPILTKKSSFSVYWFLALPSHLEGPLYRDPSLDLPFGWGFPFAADLIVRVVVVGNVGATPQAREAACRASAARADARAVALAPVIAEIRASGITEPYAIAAALTTRGVPTARGLRFWGSGTVRNLLNRLDRLSTVGALGSQIDNQENPPPRKRKSRMPQGQKALLSRRV